MLLFGASEQDQVKAIYIHEGIISRVGDKRNKSTSTIEDEKHF